MGKHIKKIQQKRTKANRWQRTCERCGNENFSPKKVYKCQYCNFWNGVKREDDF